MGVSIDTFGAGFIKYLPGVTKLLQRESPMRSIPLGDVKWEGEKLVFKIHVAYNTSIADVSDGGQIPPADQQHYIEAEALRKMSVGSVGYGRRFG